MYDQQRLQRLAHLLLRQDEQRRGEFNIPWLDELGRKRADKKRANKFFLGCILSYRINSNRAWGNARRLAERILGDPDDLWGSITSISLAEWMSRQQAYSLHWLSQAHKRVWRIGKEIVDHYQGDARNLWLGHPPAVVIDRLRQIRVGEEISQMVVGSLYDTGQIKGAGDVKADLHVCRVLGRLLKGSTMSAAQATKVTRQMNSANPWQLDGPLYRLGKVVCTSDPDCANCSLQRDCKFHNS